MPLDTLDHSAPSLFKQRASRPSQLALYSALALFLMVADARFKITEPARIAVSTVLSPVQWLVAQPVLAYQNASRYAEVQQQAVRKEDEARKELVAMAQRAELAEELLEENGHLRALLGLRERMTQPGQAAEVIYDSPDPYTRRVVIDKGETDGIAPGSPVLDEKGVVGQVTRVYATRSEVSLLIDRDQAIPVFNPRTGARSVAYGDPSPARSGGMELRFMPSNADVQEGDLLTTSGVDGLYPPGLPVAKVVTVDRRADSAFTRIYCEPVGRVQGVRHVMVLQPLNRAVHPEAEAQAAQAAADKKAKDAAKGKKDGKSDKGRSGKSGDAAAPAQPAKDPA
ncbi:rod shape-determining protein MreC [Comamonas sp. w2-DMI]|uniref:rod shape-determining protein MreC n=1 Tax=Comamonas sp. w2-DMI TaxID=3126391 RepID=UPI0032E433DB